MADDGKLIAVHAVPLKRSMVPLSPPAKASVALAPHTALSVTVVGVVFRDQLDPFHWYTKPNSPTAQVLVADVDQTSSKSGASASVSHVVPVRRWTLPR